MEAPQERIELPTHAAPKAAALSSELQGLGSVAILIRASSFMPHQGGYAKHFKAVLASSLVER